MLSVNNRDLKYIRKKTNRTERRKILIHKYSPRCQHLSLNSVKNISNDTLDLNTTTKHFM